MATTFVAGGGKLTTDFASGNDSGYSVITQADGKILVAGSSNGDFALLRYNSDGSLDTSFAGTGKLTTDFASATDAAYSEALQADGKIVVAGYSGENFAVARYNTDGSLDASFAAGGKLTTPSSIYTGLVARVQSSGSIQVGGYNYGNGSSVAYALVTYNSSGGMSSMITAGVRDTSGFIFSDGGHGIATQADGKVLVAGSSGGNFALLRYNADRNNPSLDTGFGTSGSVVTDFGSSADSGRSVTVQSDGKILVAGYSNGDFALARYNSDGSLDSSFSDDGKLTTDFGSATDYGQSITVQSDGKILVAGSSNGDIALARYNSDGSLDNVNSMQGGAGDQVFSGGDGIDTVTYAAARSHFTVTRTATGFSVKDNVGTGGTDTMANVETLKFTDMSVNLTVQANAESISTASLNSITELYVAYFNRVPDADGLNFWINEFKGGMSLNKMGDSFYANAISPDYTALTGYASTMTDTEFIIKIYQNVLRRTVPADDSGVAYWRDGLADHSQTRGSLVNTMIVAAHGYKSSAEFGWVADLLDNKLSVGKTFAVDQGLNYNSSADSITHGMEIAAAVTQTSTAAAIALIGIPDIA